MTSTKRHARQPRDKRTEWSATQLAVIVVALLSAILVHSARAQDAQPLQSGEAFVTRFSGVKDAGGRKMIDVDGAVGSIVDLRNPAQPPLGHHWLNEPQRLHVTASQVGQVFGVAFDDAPKPNIYLTATAAFGLHRTANNADWMAGMWGVSAGPGTVWKLDAANNYKPVIFANIQLKGRSNTGAALGNIAYDRWNKQLYVSDLETGMIHRIRTSDGADLGVFDHGVEGRKRFIDAQTGQSASLSQVPFDGTTQANVKNCAIGDFARTPDCWNIADFRRRVWGVGVRRNAKTKEVRLYYSVWGGRQLGSEGFRQSDDTEKRNSMWSVALDGTGAFQADSVRREFALPDFFKDPKDVSNFGRSHPVSDIAFPKCSSAQVMLVAERGGMSNLGLGQENAFARPHESRVLRYRLDDKGNWQLDGRYDVGFYDRKNHKAPRLRANSCGGVDFGYGYTTDWQTTKKKASEFVWMSGDGLCSPHGPCVVPELRQRIDGSHVHGIKGTPAFAFGSLQPSRPPPSASPKTTPDPPTGPSQSYMVDIDNNIAADGTAAMVSLTQNHATMTGDIEVFVRCDPTEDGDDPPTEKEPADPPLASNTPPLVSNTPPLVGGQPPPGGVSPPTPAGVPPADGPDLAVAKDGPAQCVAGGICRFTITITNNGPGIWSGPLRQSDTLPPGAVMVSYQPQPDWVCNQIGGTTEVVCSSDWMTLDTGDSTQFEIDVIVPTSSAGQTLQNCTTQMWLPSPDPTDPGTMTSIEQVLSGAGYTVGPVDGYLDVVTQSAIALYQFDNGLPQSGLPDQVLLDSLFSSGAGLPGDRDPSNDSDCQSVNITNPPIMTAPLVADLAVGKIQTTGKCQPGGLCNFQMMFINRGPADWTGIVEVRDELPPGATLVRAAAGCSQSGTTVTCRYPRRMTLPPNSPGRVNLTVRLPQNMSPLPLNCATLAPSMVRQDPNAGNNRFCIPIRLAPKVADIAVHKAQVQKECRPGANCDFDLWFINNGPQAWTGEPQLIETLPPNAKFVSASAPWRCGPNARGTLCRHNRITLLPGQAVKATVKIRLPATATPDQKNCIRSNVHKVAYADPVPSNNRHCVAVQTKVPPPAAPAKPQQPIAPQPLPPLEPADTTVEKRQMGPCKPNKSCLFELKFINKGPGTWSGKVKLADIVPDPAITLGTHSPSIWKCDQDGTAIECEHSGATIRPNEHLSLWLALKLPGHVSANARNCAVIERTETAPIDPDLDGNRVCVPINTSTPGFSPRPPAIIEPCGKGYVRREGRCVRVARQCPSGYRLRNNRCYSTTLSCPKGYRLKGKKCYSTRPSCPKGYTLRRGRCYSNRRTCPRGYVLRGNRCYSTRLTCPRGYYLRGRRCYPRRLTCPRGYYLRGRRCYPIYRRVCPPGYYQVGNLCLRFGGGGGGGRRGGGHLE
jgi:peptidoglycan hydrolase-like protein with peptidoglycan-binding domain